MKRRNSSKLAIGLALASVPFLTGCGSSSSSSIPVTAAAAGLVCTGGACYPVSPNGCIPLSSPITFIGTGLEMTGMNIIGGAIPPGNGAYATTSIGTMVTNETQSVGVGGATFSDNEVAGELEMQVQSAAPGTLAATTANVSGELEISSLQQTAIVDTIMSEYPMGLTSTTTIGTMPYYGYGYGSSSLCVSGMAIQGYLYTTGGYGFGGSIYLYLNNTQHGYVIQFE